MLYTRCVADSPHHESYVEIFCSYSHSDKDKVLKKEFDTSMRPYVRKKLLQVWHDGRIGAGDEWAADIDQHLVSADIIVFLISPDFLNSDYCVEKELHVALERKSRKEALVVPIIVRDCAWKETPLADLQALPAEARPVTQWADRDSAWKSVGDGLKARAAEVLTRKLEFLKKNEQSLQKLAPSPDDAGMLGGMPSISMSAKEWERVRLEAEQARSIYKSIMRDAEAQKMDRWKIQQDMQSKIFALIGDVTTSKPKTADKSFNNMDEYIRG